MSQCSVAPQAWEDALQLQYTRQIPVQAAPAYTDDLMLKNRPDHCNTDRRQQAYCKEVLPPIFPLFVSIFFSAKRYFRGTLFLWKDWKLDQITHLSHRCSTTRSEFRSVTFETMKFCLVPDIPLYPLWRCNAYTDLNKCTWSLENLQKNKKRKSEKKKKKKIHLLLASNTRASTLGLGDTTGKIILRYFRTFSR